MIKCYYKNLLLRWSRFIKKNIEAFIHIVANGTNDIGLLNYKKQYLSVTPINEYASESAFYGISNCLQEYAIYDKVIAASIEHGVYLGENTYELEKYNLPCVLTYGQWRRDALRQITNRPVFMIGPYILYADIEKYKVEMTLEKEKLGKCAIVFPAHSLEWNDMKYDEDEFGIFVKQFSLEHEVDTILVSLYFNDIKKYASTYEKYGYKVVCSGHRTDRDFLKRQRALLELSDFVLTNSVGTHIGYAIALNKPVSLFVQDVSYVYHEEKEGERDLAYRTQGLFYNNKSEIEHAFKGYYTEITKKQRDVIEKFWGTSHVRSKEELYFILTSIDWVWKKSKTSNESYESLMKCYLNTLQNEKYQKIIEESME